jgi:hypothetical protein
LDSESLLLLILINQFLNSLSFWRILFVIAGNFDVDLLLFFDLWNSDIDQSFLAGVSFNFFLNFRYGAVFSCLLNFDLFILFMNIIGDWNESDLIDNLVNFDANSLYWDSFRKNINNVIEKHVH